MIKRACTILLSFAAVAAPAHSALPERGALASHSLPEARFEFGGVVGERMRANVDAWLLPAPAANPGMLEMFRVRDRQPAPKVVDWAGEFAGKYLLSAVQALRMTDRPELRAQVAAFVADLVSTQAEDGYLGPFRKSQRLRANWDLWGHYHVMQGLLMWHEHAGDEAAFTAVKRAADLVCATYLDQPRRVFDAGSHEMNMAIHHVLATLHRLTSEARYERMILEIEKDWERAGDYLRTGLAGVDFYKTPRPRWESLHDLQGLVERWRLTGDERYRQAFEHHWHSILRTDVHNAGSFSSGEQAHGNPYSPGAIETCCTIAWMALSIDMLQLTGDPRVADELERSTLNGALGAQHPSGRWWTYDTPMDGAREASAHTIVFQARAGTPELNCCSVNGPRALGMLTEWAVTRAGAGLAINWHGPLVARAKLADGTPVTLRCESDLPRGGQARWVVEFDGAPRRLALRWRIPGWSETTRVSVAGAPPIAAPAGEYLETAREWRSGDAVEFTFDMRLRALPGEREAAGKVSLFRGPLLLAYDPRHNSFDEAQIPRIDLAQLSAATLPADARSPRGPGQHAPSEGQDARATQAFAPWLLVDLPAIGGAIRLCDYANAGATGTRYRSWLRTPQPATDVALAPDGAFVRAALRGTAEPQFGKLRQAKGGVATTGPSGEAGGAVRLSGKREMLIYGLPAEFGGDFTIAVRVRVNALPEGRIAQVFSAWSAIGDDPLRLTIEAGKLHARVESGGYFSTPGVAVERDRWMHVAAVKAGSQLTLFIDGKAVASADAPAAVESSAMVGALGGNPKYAGNESLAADLAEFAGFARALTTEEIAALASRVAQ